MPQMEIWMLITISATSFWQCWRKELNQSVHVKSLLLLSRQPKFFFIHRIIDIINGLPSLVSCLGMHRTKKCYYLQQTRSRTHVLGNSDNILHKNRRPFPNVPGAISLFVNKMVPLVIKTVVDSCAIAYITVSMLASQGCLNTWHFISGTTSFRKHCTWKCKGLHLMINHQNGFFLYNIGKGQTTLTSILSEQLTSWKDNIITMVSNTAIENANRNIS